MFSMEASQAAVFAPDAAGKTEPRQTHFGSSYMATCNVKSQIKIQGKSERSGLSFIPLTGCSFLDSERCPHPKKKNMKINLQV